MIPRGLIDWWYGALLMVGAALCLSEFFNPADPLYQVRDTQTLLYAQSYWHGAALLAPTIAWVGPHPVVAVLELPLYSMLVFAVNHIFPIMTAGRSVSIGLGAASVVLFDRLLSTLAHPRRRTAVVLFALAPVTIYVAHSTQPDILYLACLLGAAFAAVRAFRGASWQGWIVGACALTAVAATIKPMALLALGPPMLYDAHRRGRLWQGVGVLVFGTAAMMGWALYDRTTLLRDAPKWYAYNTRPEWLWGPPSLRADPHFYLTLLIRLMLMLLPAGTALFLIRAAWMRTVDPYWWLWLAGASVATLTFAMLNFVHFYYQLDLIPGLAAAAASGAMAWQHHSLWQRSLAVVAVAIASALPAQALLAPFPRDMQAGRALAKVATPGRSVVVLNDAPTTTPTSHFNPFLPTVLFYAQRSGWNLPLNVSVQEIGRLPEKVCTLAVVQDHGVPRAPLGWHVVDQGAGWLVADSDQCRAG